MTPKWSVYITGGASAGGAKVQALMSADVSRMSYAELLRQHCARFVGSSMAAGGGAGSMGTGAVCLSQAT